MADNEHEGGAAESAEAVAPTKSKLKLIIIVVGVLAILGGGAATYFVFFNHHNDEEKRVEAPAAKPPSFVDSRLSWSKCYYHKG